MFNGSYGFVNKLEKHKPASSLLPRFSGVWPNSGQKPSNVGRKKIRIVRTSGFSGFSEDYPSSGSLDQFPPFISLGSIFGQNISPILGECPLTSPQESVTIPKSFDISKYNVYILIFTHVYRNINI